MSRVGTFSSSEIWKLTKLGRDKKSFGAIALTYIEEKKMERKLGRALTPFTFSRPTSWGTFLESYAYDRIIEQSNNWKLVSDGTRFKHEELPWTGVPDLLDGRGAVGDIKCPYTLKSFCEMSDTNDLKQDKPEYYWQLVSNAILTKCDIAYLFVYCPYKGELKKIRKHFSQFEEMSWIHYLEDKELPYLILGNEYNDIATHTFEIPKEDIEFLTEQVTKATELL